MAWCTAALTVRARHRLGPAGAHPSRVGARSSLHSPPAAATPSRRVPLTSRCTTPC